MLTDAQQRNAAKKFAAEWKGRGYEKGETHAFWINFRQEIYNTLVETSTIQQNFDEFVQENNKIDDEYEKISNIEVNCEPFPMPTSIIRFGSEGNLGINSKFIDFNPGIKELKTLRISKQFDKIAEQKLSIFIVYSLVWGKLKAYEK